MTRPCRLRELLERIAGRAQAGQHKATHPIGPVCGDQDGDRRAPGMAVEVESLQTQAVGKRDEQSRECLRTGRHVAGRRLALTRQIQGINTADVGKIVRGDPPVPR